MTTLRDAAMNSKAWPFEEARRVLKRYEKWKKELNKYMAFLLCGYCSAQFFLLLYQFHFLILSLIYFCF